MMKCFSIFDAAAAAFAALSIFSCTADTLPESVSLPLPEAAVCDISCNSFTVRWDAVTDAGSYTYIFDGGEPQTTDKTSVTCSGLEPATVYTFSLKADKGWNGNFRDSEYVHFRITTTGITALDTPEPKLVASYMSKTIFSWIPVHGATSYEYEIGPYKGNTELCNIELGGLSASTEYVFRLRAVSSDPYLSASEYAEFTFTTKGADEDIPQILLELIESGSDYISFNVYALPDQNYLFFAIPASYFESSSEDRIRDIYMNYFRSAAESAGLSIAAAVKEYAMYGTGNYTEAPVYPEMCYYVVVIGIDKDGNVNSPLVKVPAKTLADGTTDVAPLSGQNWFSQSLFYGTFGAYNPSNSLWVKWEGGIGDAVSDPLKKVRVMKNLLTSTYSYRTFFDSDTEMLKMYVESQGTEFKNADDIKKLNNGGFTSYYKLPSATSYTLATVVEAEDGSKGFAVTTLSTKASEKYYDWAFVKLGAVSDRAVLAATLSIAFDSAESLNLQMSEVRYLMKPTSEINGVSIEDAAALVEKEGTLLAKPSLDLLNMTGSVRLQFGDSGEMLEPGTKYTLLVNFTSNSSDKVTRFATATVSGTSTLSVRSSYSSGNIEARPMIGNVKILETFDVENE